MQTLKEDLNRLKESGITKHRDVVVTGPIHSTRMPECRTESAPISRPESRPAGRNLLTFRGEFSPLSNFYKCENSVMVFGEMFDNNEKAYQYAKAYFHNANMDLLNQVINAEHPLQAKKIGDSILTSPEWDQVKEDYMLEALKAKANASPQFRNTLFENRHMHFVEATENKYWGSGHNVEMTKSRPPGTWVGKNRLGALLSKLCYDLFREPQSATADNATPPCQSPKHSEQHQPHREGRQNVDQSPKVLIIGDSNIKQMDSARFSGKIKTQIVGEAYTTEIALNELQNRRHLRPNAVVLHVGTNHVKDNKTSTHTCANKITSLINSALKLFEHTQVIVSPIPPSQSDEIADKIGDVNNLVRDSFRGNTRVSWVDHTALCSYDYNRAMYRFFKDSIHLNDRGVKILAAAIKRAIQNTLYY